MRSSIYLPDNELQSILDLAEAPLRELNDANLLLVGCTGFFGSWLLQSLAHAKARLGLQLRTTVITRSSAALQSRLGSIVAALEAEIVQGDVRDPLVKSLRPTHVLHAATDTTSDPLNPEPASATVSVIVDGTRAVLDASQGAERLLYCSSGAVYGPQHPSVRAMPEDAPFAPEPTSEAQAYGNAKRFAEHLVALAAAEGRIRSGVIARGYAFCAPGLPLDAHFAVGNFLREAARGQPVRLRGDGTPVRTYMYGTDLAVWLWTFLSRGRSGAAYNLGSDEEVTIACLAEHVSKLGRVPLERQANPVQSPRSRYVPSIERARRELGLDVTVPLSEALEKTLHFARRAHRR